jgi:DNA-binding response OmpR family regulator
VLSSLEGRRILVIEDEYLIAIEVEDVLRDLGADVVGPFARLGPAFDWLGRGQVHGAVLDVRLNGDTTEGLAALLVSRRVPVLVASGYGTEQLPVELRELPRLRKPFTEPELRARVMQVFEHAPSL